MDTNTDRFGSTLALKGIWDELWFEDAEIAYHGTREDQRDCSVCEGMAVRKFRVWLEKNPYYAMPWWQRPYWWIRTRFSPISESSIETIEIEVPDREE